MIIIISETAEMNEHGVMDILHVRTQVCTKFVINTEDIEALLCYILCSVLYCVCVCVCMTEIAGLGLRTQICNHRYVSEEL